MKSDREIIEGMITDFLRTRVRSVCICNNPEPGEFCPIYFWTKCKNCGRELSMERCMNCGITK